MTIGERIKQRREHAGLSRIEAADAMTKAGRPTRESDFYRWEKNRNKPDIDALMALSGVLEASVDYFLGLSARPARRGVRTTQEAA